jgi:hypothetical protein
MNYNDFKKLAEILREDLVIQKRQQRTQDALLFRMVKSFQTFCARERPNTYRSFALFSREHHAEYKFALDPDEVVARKQIGNKCDDAKRGYATSFIPLMLFFMWSSMRPQLHAFMEEARDLDPYISYFLKGGTGRQGASKRGIMRQLDINARVRTNLLDWEIANRRVEHEKTLKTNILSFYNLFIDSIPEQALHFHEMTHLSVSSTLVTSIMTFGSLSKLRVFDCSYNQIDSLDGLQVKNLDQLFIGVTNIDSIDLLIDAAKLRKLYMGSTNVSSLTSLKNCLELEFLSCEDTEITSLDGLENCQKLKYIDCSDTALQSVTPLCQMSDLEDVILNGCHIDMSFEQLIELPSLKRLLIFQGSAEGTPSDLLSRESFENCLPRVREFHRRKRSLANAN